jgi:hypothetical protein
VTQERLFPAPPKPRSVAGLSAEQRERNVEGARRVLEMLEQQEGKKR